MLKPEITRFVFNRDGWKCRHCKDRNYLHPHHVVYKSHGGPDEPNNLITLCWQCHRAHHDGLLDIVFREQLVNDVAVQFFRNKGWKPS